MGRLDNIDALLDAAVAAADVAGAVIRPHFRTSLAADLKADRSPVTIADRTAELAIRAVLAERFPAHGIDGEEFAPHNPGAAPRWMLDPIDGTRAFITGRPAFGTLIALLDGDTPLLGLIDQPVLGERWVAAAGRQTRFHGPFGGVAGCRPCASLDAAELSCTTPDMFRGVDAAGFARLAGSVGRVSYGGDCYAYGLLALGQLDVIAEASLKPWDWAALLPVVEGAGGRMTDWRGRALSRGGDGRVLAVGDPALLEPALRLLEG